MSKTQTTIKTVEPKATLVIPHGMPLPGVIWETAPSPIVRVRQNGEWFTGCRQVWPGNSSL